MERWQALLDLCPGEITVERKLYLELCQRQAMKGGVLVEYDGISYQPYAYELKFQPDGKILTGDNAIKLYYSQKSKRIVSDPTATKEYGCFRGSEKHDDLEYDFL